MAFVCSGKKVIMLHMKVAGFKVVIHFFSNLVMF